jgi:hypothetical protein
MEDVVNRLSAQSHPSGVRIATTDNLQLQNIENFGHHQGKTGTKRLKHLKAACTDIERSKMHILLRRWSA